MELEKEQIIKSYKYKDLITEKEYLKNLFGYVVTRFGDGIDTIAFSLLVFQITKSATLTAFTFAVNGIPNLIFGMISGVVASYYSKKVIMFICDIGRGVMASLIVVLYMSGNLEVWHLFVITFISSAFEAFRGPASTSLFPHIISKEKLDIGMALNSTLTQISQFVGLAIAAPIIAIVGLSGAVIIDAMTFIVCGLAVIAIKYNDQTLKQEKITLKSGFIDLKDGFKYVLKSRLVMFICLSGALLNALTSPVESLGAVYVDSLGLGPEGLSFISGATLVGMALGGIVFPKINRKIKSKFMFIIGGIMLGTGYFVMSFIINTNLKELLLISSALDMGIGISFISMPINIVFMKKIEKSFISRASSIMNAILLCSMPLASFVTGIIVKFLSVEILYGVLGVGVIVIFISQFYNKTLEEIN